MTKAAPKAPDTREKLLNAGARVFALYGYEGASTRQLAKEAGVNISAILYYFNGKEGYYAAVLDHIATMAQSVLGGPATAIRAALAEGGLKDAQYLDLLHGFLAALTRFLLSDKATADLGRIFIREQMDPTPAFDHLYEKTLRPMHEMLTALVAKATGLSPGTDAVLCTQMLVGQCVFFKTHREVALRGTGWKNFGAKETEKILSHLRLNTEVVIRAHKREGKNR
ncbi:MAG TPA: CerR family C-terminal domain-containing protein [Patescibacteria group bacterium]|nr:CerR family C-terminal domain-containing protein [Patescibacteria group bacterium]